MKFSLTKTWTVILTSLALTFSAIGVTPARAAGVVGDGTPGSCTEAAFNAALIGGGAITFDCGPNPVTITLTSPKYLKFAITIDGGGLITLDGNSGIRLFDMLTWVGPAHMELKNITLIHGYAGAGGAVYIEVDQTVWMENVTIQDSHATGDGGAIYVDTNGTLTLTNVVFDGNGSGEEGGAVYNNQGALNFTNVLFQGNAALGWGGGINNNGGTATITDSTFSGNVANFGGGMFNLTSSPVMTNVIFSGNTADYGGGMYNSTSSPVLTNVTFSGNVANYFGGGMSNGTSSPTLMNVTFSGNKALLADGGGMENLAGSNPILMNVTFSGNSAIWEGGGMSNGSSNPILTNVTFSGNTSEHDGGGMSNETSSPQIRNTIFWGNTASNGTQIADFSSAASVSDSVIQDGYAGGTNITTTDPNLGALGNYGGFTQTIPLLAGSSAIDMGDDAFCPATDQRGIARPQGAHCDIGSFELKPSVYALFLPLILR